MKKVLLFMLGAAAIAAGVYGRRARRRLSRHNLTEAARQMATEGGLAAVDPEPLTTFGEAVDRDAVTEAHRSVRDQRDKLPPF